MQVEEFGGNATSLQHHPSPCLKNRSNRQGGERIDCRHGRPHAKHQSRWVTRPSPLAPRPSPLAPPPSCSAASASQRARRRAAEAEAAAAEGAEGGGEGAEGGGATSKNLRRSANYRL